MNNEAKKRLLMGLIRSLHEGADPDEAKARFKDLLGNVTPTEIAEIEEGLIEEGLPREEIQRLCELHLKVFQEALEKEKTLAPEGHPIHILMDEHAILLRYAAQLRDAAQQLVRAKGPDSAAKPLETVAHLVEQFKGSESHYLREENVLFPYLEKHGITQPPAIMWMEHDQIREIKKNLYRAVDVGIGAHSSGFARQLQDAASPLAEMLASHFHKENNILFPAAMNVIADDEWPEVKRQFDDLGYCAFTPGVQRQVAADSVAGIAAPAGNGEITFDTGALSMEQLEGILNTLPVDITFVDERDTVRYFSQSKDRIFARAKAVIGRTVQQCHPQKSLHVVNQIVDDFRSGRRDHADFWINLKGRLIYIRYFPVRDREGKYRGCLEVTQDITDIQKLQGEKRLLQ